MAYIVQYANGVPAVKHEISQLSMSIGEGMENDVCLPEDGVSALHAVLVAVQDEASEAYRYFIKPADTDLSISVNDSNVSDLIQLHENDLLQIGEVTLRFTNENDCLIKSKAAPVIRDFPSKEPATERVNEDPAFTVDDALQASRFSRRLNIF